MKKFLALLLSLSLTFSLVACGTDKPSSETDSISSGGLEEVEDGKNSTVHQYIGEYQQEHVYQKIIEIETCNNPDTLCTLLSELYDEEISYIKLEYAGVDPEKWNRYKEPYADFVCFVNALYNTNLETGPISSDTFLFFRPYSESPSFVMDSDRTYIVSTYEMQQFGNETYGHSINGWYISDLFMCLHEFIDADTEEKDFMRDAVHYMDYYIEFENLIIDTLGVNEAGISKTESLNPSIDIISVEVVGPTMHELNVKYQIKNISEKRGVVYLTCSNHAYQDELHFNDENFKNDHQEDGCFEYNIGANSGEDPTTFTIFYGYGEFDAYKGWDNEKKTTISFYYTDDYEKMCNSDFGVDNVSPLYFEGQQIGYWTEYGY